MANNTATPGFHFRRQRNGATQPVVELCEVATAYGTGIFRGDPVKRVNDGTIDICAAGEKVYGIADGAEQYWDGSALRRGTYLPASTTWGSVRERKSLVRVILARDAIFEVDVDDATTATTEATYQALVGENCDHVAGTGSTATGQSGYKLDISTHVATEAQWRIIGLSTQPGIDWSGSNAKVLVEASESIEPQYYYGTAGI